MGLSLNNRKTKVLAKSRKLIMPKYTVNVNGIILG